MNADRLRYFVCSLVHTKELMNMTDDELKSRLIDYVAWFRLWHRLDENKPGDDLNDLYDKIFYAEKDILDHFGLPQTNYFLDILSTLVLRKNIKLKHFDHFLKDLKVEADKYHLGSIHSDLKLLELAQSYKLEIGKVLPELTLRLNPEPYYVYLYYAQLLKGLAGPAEVLQELRIIQENELSLKLCQLSENKNLLDNPKYMELFEYDLKFLMAFLSEFEQTFDGMPLFNTSESIQDFL